MSPHRTATGLTSHAPRDESDLLPRWARFAPLALVALALAIDLPTPGAFSGDVFLILSSMIAACVYSLRAVIGVAALNSVAGLVFLFARHMPSDGEHAVVDYVAMVVLAWASVPLCRLRLSLLRRLLGAERVAESAQRAVLPPVRAWWGNTWIAVRYEAASAAASVGGDLYAAEHTSYGVRLLIGDVRGKGLNAVPDVAALVGSFHEAAHHTPTLPELARHLDEAVSRHTRETAAVGGESNLSGEHFITAVIAQIPDDGTEVRLISRGHCPAFLVNGTGLQVWEPEHPGLPLGLGEFDAGPWADESRPFGPGSLLLLCTDGLLEARDADGRFYTPDKVLRESWRQGPPTVVDRLAQTVHAHTDGVLRDDLALVAVTRAESRPAPGTDVGAGGRA
ncbi:serine/threonine-protein phosphatase [Streptomyces sp. NBC_01166]|uniref:PP2C family protein-serine/threonine phosphatase n=1 Tax=Streptomyces sp. NBC_01166 TaxID=2903755 RepID=UPI00386EEBE1|nr:serine/threonine-protein phosphatase [Streptomyces sp. NBC_01166]